MVTLEALNALAGDCLLLQYPGTSGQKRLWIIDGGPRRGGNVEVWKDVLLERLKGFGGAPRLPVMLGMVSHIDDDHINGMQKLTSRLRNSSQNRPGEVEFERFWFNSFDKLVGAAAAGASTEATTAAMQSVDLPFDIPDSDREHAKLLMQSVAQGNALASDLRALGLEGNRPVNGFVVARKQPYPFDGAQVTVLGPLQKRLDKLRDEWAKAWAKPTKEAKQAALQSLFVPKSREDASVPNLSSIVVLVEVGSRRLLLTGDAHGDDVVEAWQDLGLGGAPAKVDLVKMPHHGSIRNCTVPFLRFFEADHYVFSADGKHGNPDQPTLEAVVKIHGGRGMTMHFTNADVSWDKPYALEKNGKTASNLRDLLALLHEAYPGPWLQNLREADKVSVVVDLP